MAPEIERNYGLITMFTVLCLIVIALFALTGCGDSGERDETTTAPVPEQKVRHIEHQIDFKKIIEIIDQHGTDQVNLAILKDRSGLAKVYSVPKYQGTGLRNDDGFVYKIALYYDDNDPNTVLALSCSADESPSDNGKIIGEYLLSEKVGLKTIVHFNSPDYLDALKEYAEAKTTVASRTREKTSETSGKDFSTATAEKTISFGSYQGEAIEWIVLDTKGEELFLLSKYALDFQPYNTAKENVTWETCSLREWLNNNFYDEAFSSDEKERIYKIKVHTGDNSKYGTSGGNDTEDKLFLINTNEYESLREADKKCYMTEYAKQRTHNNDPEWYEQIINKFGGACGWWLLSPGYNSSCAVCVTGSGSVIPDGRRVQDNNVGIRPAMWIKK